MRYRIAQKKDGKWRHVLGIEMLDKAMAEGLARGLGNAKAIPIRERSMGKKKAKIPKFYRKFYRCGICDCYHPATWDGDCPDDLDAKFGINGWQEVDMPPGDLLGRAYASVAPNTARRTTD